ncbi:PREDICTED: uncharacterized protein At4g26485-like [Tarenaya hassleriana]|uniref:uncharacterized protein At4g26485-like n=1 Tax=Tarenaya hassleriana TaxID=28532 RepID=UPI00053C7B4A|nr:PREDICTED: uncharacterized protein At4g26485-like [Tarenaya hassleriana]
MGGGAKRVKSYSSDHQILLVGEGDLSFSLSLAKAFGSASNITATSLDTLEELESNYRDGKSNVQELKDLGGTVIHGVNVHTMTQNCIIRSKRYDMIVFNFPHAGFTPGLSERNPLAISRHQEVVRGSAKNVVKRFDGEIHVTHKAAYPFSEWNIETLGEKEGLTLLGSSAFNMRDYPGYSNKRGSGFYCDSAFPVGQSVTFRFSFH